MNTSVATLPAAQEARPKPPSLIARIAAKFHVDPDKMMVTLKDTAFRQGATDPPVTNEQMMALLVVADQYGLNPWTKELYAFPDKHRGIVPIVGLDGWSRIVNDHAAYDGVDFEYGPPSAVTKYKGCPEWIACSIWRKDRKHATIVREILAECYRDTGPWNSHPSRMLRHKAFMQAGRLAFSFVGIYDEDEAQRIIEGESSVLPEPSAGVAAINDAVTGKGASVENKTSETILGESARVDETADAKADAATSAKAPSNEGKKQESAAPTFATVAEAINKADTVDALNIARDLIRSVENKQHARDLNLAAADRQKELEAK